MNNAVSKLKDIGTTEARLAADLMVGIYNKNPGINLKDAMLKADEAIKGFSGHPTYSQMVVAVDGAKSAFTKHLIQETPKTVNLVEKALQEELAKPTRDLTKIEQYKKMLGRQERASKEEIQTFKRLYNEYLKLTDPSKAWQFPVDADWGSARFNRIWGLMDGLAGMTRKLSDAKLQKGQLVEV